MNSVHVTFIKGGDVVPFVTQPFHELLNMLQYEYRVERFFVN